jgi:hypothetical protein
MLTGWVPTVISEQLSINDPFTILERAFGYGTLQATDHHDPLPGLLSNHKILPE